MDGRSSCHLRTQREAREGRRCIARLERQLDQQRADLTHIDGVLRLLAPESDPEAIKPKRAYVRRTHYFARNELSRSILGALRDAEGKPLSADEIVGQVLAAKGYDLADAVMRGTVRKQALMMLRTYRKRGMVEQTGLGRGMRWKLAHRVPD